MASLKQAPWINTYQLLGPAFYAQQLATPVAQPELIRYNASLASQLGLDSTPPGQEDIAILAGNAVADNSQPIACAYAGHQFGYFNPQLGDGRAVLLGELIGADKQRYDVQLKGSGPTPFSRQGDGRSPLGPVLREYIVSEAMAALAIPTTRSLAAVTTGERVLRDTPQPGAILTRVASSHIRVGTMEFFATRRKFSSVKALADYTIERHYQAFVDEHFAQQPYLGLLTAVAQAQAKLIAQWMSVGFIHGVMNTDNMLLCGETVDYGPCAFMDNYNPQQVYSSIDRDSRYAYGNQPEIAVWNLSCLARCLLKLLDENEMTAVKLAEGVLNDFATVYQQHYQTLFAAKLGFNRSDDSTEQLVDRFLIFLQRNKLDFTQAFRSLISYTNGADCGLEPALDFTAIDEGFNDWLNQWQATLAANNIDYDQAASTMLQHNPLYIPRNHWIQRAIDQATDDQDFTLFHQMVDALAKPFDYQPQYHWLASAPQKHEEIVCTFCGT